MRYLAIAAFVFLVGGGMAYADAPHHGNNNYVYCELNGQPVYIEGQNFPSHRLSAQDIEYMKAFCVREALYGGMGEGYWQMPVTEADMKAAKFVVYNQKGT